MLPENAPRLAGYISMPQLATALGVSRQSVHKRMMSGEFESIRTVGDRPSYIISEEEAEELIEFAGLDPDMQLSLVIPDEA